MCGRLDLERPDHEGIGIELQHEFLVTLYRNPAQAFKDPRAVASPQEGKLPESGIVEYVDSPKTVELALES